MPDLKEILKNYGPAIGPSLAFLLGLLALFGKYRVEQWAAQWTLNRRLRNFKRLALSEAPGRLMNFFQIPRVILSCALLLFLARPTLVGAIQVDPGQKTRNELPTQIDKNVGGDFDVLKKRRAIRVLVVYNKTNFFVDKGQPRGITYEGSSY
jgi:hypothetical protein